jgi:hypothetical protein
MSEIDTPKSEEFRLKFSNPSASHTCTLHMILAYQEKQTNLMKSLKGKVNDETLKSKIRPFQENTRKTFLIFQHADVDNSLLHVLEKHRMCPLVNKTYFQTTERKSTLLLDYLP